MKTIVITTLAGAVALLGLANFAISHDLSGLDLILAFASMGLILLLVGLVDAIYIAAIRYKKLNQPKS